MITNGYQIVLLFLATVGVLACDSFMAIIIVSTLIFARLIKFDMDEMEEDLQKKDTILAVRCRFRNILLMHKEAFR